MHVRVGRCVYVDVCSGVCVSSVTFDFDYVRFPRFLFYYCSRFMLLL